MTHLRAFKLLRGVHGALVEDAVDGITKELGHDVNRAAQRDGIGRGNTRHDLRIIIIIVIIINIMTIIIIMMMSIIIS